MLAHSHIWYYWKGRSWEDRLAESQRFAGLVSASTKGSAISPNHQANGANAQMAIGMVEWRIFVELAAEAADRFGFTDADKDALFSRLTTTIATITDLKPASSPLAGFAGNFHGITEREREVLRLVALGKNNPEIVAELFISVNTVTRHITNIFAKTSTRNRV